MRTHTRYELQDSTSIEEGPPGGDESADSPHPGSLGSTAGPSRSISSESADIPMPNAAAAVLPPPLPTGAIVLKRQQPLTNKPPSPMDTEDQNRSILGAPTAAAVAAAAGTARPTMERSCTS